MAVHHRHVGRPVPRAEGRDKVSGRATYAGDVTLPGMLWGKVLRSPVPYGRIKRIDTSRAEQLEGVKPSSPGESCGAGASDAVSGDMPILADDVVRFAGEKVAAVAAATQQIAHEASISSTSSTRSWSPYLIRWRPWSFRRRSFTRR